MAVTANAIYTGTDKGNYETESVSITITRSECEHKNTEIINKKDATCSVEGYTGDTYCKDCGEKLATGTTIEKNRTRSKRRLHVYLKLCAVFVAKLLVKWMPITMCIQP